MPLLPHPLTGCFLLLSCSQVPLSPFLTALQLDFGTQPAHRWQSHGNSSSLGLCGPSQVPITTFLHSEGRDSGWFPSLSLPTHPSPPRAPAPAPDRGLEKEEAAAEVASVHGELVGRVGRVEMRWAFVQASQRGQGVLGELNPRSPSHCEEESGWAQHPPCPRQASQEARRSFCVPVGEEWKASHGIPGQKALPRKMPRHKDPAAAVCR